MSVILRFQSSGAVPGDGRPVTMRGPSLTIGRGAENDMVLPDPDRQISKTHCVIENHNGNLVVVDLSTNGTFLNYGKIALGRTPTPLNDGDVLILGAYELVVQVSLQSSEPAAPLMDDRASFGMASRAPDPMRLLEDAAPGGDFLDGLLGSAAPKGPGQFRNRAEEIDLLPPLGDDMFLGSAPTPQVGPAMRDHSPAGSDAFRPPAASRAAIPDDWDDLLAPTPAVAPPVAAIPDDDPFNLAAPELGPEPVPELVPEPFAAVPAPLVAAPPEPVMPPPAPFDPFATDPNRPGKPTAVAVDSAIVAPPANADAARAFLAAVGVDDLRITDAELPATMMRLGQTMRAMITGLREILMTRTSIKSEFRIEQTMVNVGGNNPLKFSISPEQAIEAMIKPTVRGYLPAEQAATQALEDIKAHEVAMVTGMEAALKGVLTRLDPALLTQKIEARGGFGGFLKNRKAQYWETYEAMYAEIADQAQNDFHEVFAREFATAYKDQLARLKAQK